MFENVYSMYKHSKSMGPKTTLEPHGFHCMDKKKNILPNYFFCIQQ